MKAPTSLRIGGRRWAISYPKELPANAAGLCHYDEGRLEARNDLDAFEKRDAVLHEATHALLYMRDHTTFGNKQEERYVRSIATGLIGLLQDNPEFAQWLIQQIENT